MENENARECAFPVAASYNDECPNVLVRQGGLTKREYFAAMALHGLLANKEYWDDKEKDHTWIVKNCIAYADALLNQLNQPS